MVVWAVAISAVKKKNRVSECLRIDKIYGIKISTPPIKAFGLILKMSFSPSFCKKIIVLYLLIAVGLVAHSQKDQKDTITIIGVGDVMLGTSYPQGYLAPDDGKHLLSPVASYLRKANIT